MSPFSRVLKQFRLARNLKQKDMADLLGYEPSYLSALERSVKGPPRQDFIRRLTLKLGLDDREQRELEKALKASNRQLTLPAAASDDEYDIWSMLGLQIGRLGPKQVTLIRLALEFPKSSTGSEGCSVTGKRARPLTSQEAPKM